MANITNIPAPRVPLIDERTGLISREWYRFLVNLFTLTGSGTPQDSVADLLVSPASPPVTAPETLLNNDPQQDGSLDQLTELSKQVEAAGLTTRAELGTLSEVNIDGVPYIGFATAPPYIGANAGQLWYDSVTGSFNAKMGNNLVTQQIGEELYQYGKASATINDSPLQIVYQTGTVGASGTITFAPTVAGITDPDLVLGVATEPLALNDFGRVTTHGVVRDITTNGTAYGEVWADGDHIWYDPVSGNPTNVKPSAPNIKIQIGTIIKAGSGGSGSFSVNLGASSTLGGTDSNVQLGSLFDADLLQYDSTAQYWSNVSTSSVQVLSWLNVSL